ncbi:hypothetical protein [Mucilaginibacter sp.]
MKRPFKQVYAFRRGFIKPIKVLSKTHSYYKYVNWLFPIGRAIYPAGFCRLPELATAMMHVVNYPYSKKVVEGKDILLAKEAGRHA